ncbi:MAG: hypothetical protein ACD_20C00223G0007 [uncultured bacterium]|nr:MAG: hypothetical protein ACD_20C00223G0007 [uncultured bacterium]HBH19155.1 hypothetical protein [Cyanobacteria bacterium UBA9579]
MTSYILIPFIILNLAIGKIDPIQLNPAYEKTTISQDGVLRGNIAVSTDLPQEFYGTWSVIGNIIRTNNPDVFKGKSSDIWTFDKFQEVITLTNPVSKASASIKVNEVQGKTAVFTRENFTDKVKQYEKAKITVDGDKFFGVDIITVEHYRWGKLINTSIVEYEVSGSKISGPRLEDIFAK